MSYGIVGAHQHQRTKRRLRRLAFPTKAQREAIKRGETAPWIKGKATR